MQSQVYTFTNALAVEQSNCLRAALLEQKVMSNTGSVSFTDLKIIKSLQLFSPVIISYLCNRNTHSKLKVPITSR